MKKNRDKHPLNQSPFFKLYSTPRLCELLQISRDRLEFLTSSNNHYNVFDKNQNGKIRQIETPKPILSAAHQRIFQLFSRIDTPEYLHSGVKGRSYLTNANAHDGAAAGFKLDIKKFYPSTTREHIYRCFRQQFRCSHTVATKLAALVAINGHLPTGSQVSQCLAYFSHMAMFDEIKEVIESHGGTLTVYVDDIFVSIEHVKHWQLKRIGRIINRHGLEWHKHRVFRARSPKLITGVIKNGNDTHLPNSKHLKLKNSYGELRAARDHETRLNVARSISGQLTTGSQVEANLKDKARSARGYARHLERK